MTVYYYDLFTGASGGTAGTLLSSTTADSGATWPTSSSYNIGNAIDIDGNGNIFSSISGTAVQIPSAIQPSSYNFEVQYSFDALPRALLELSPAFCFLAHFRVYWITGNSTITRAQVSPLLIISLQWEAMSPVRQWEPSGSSRWLDQPREAARPSRPITQ